jgi:hypothetical protein
VPLDIEAAVTNAGVLSADWAAFVQRHGKPPGCYEKRCWYLKAVEKELGKAAAIALAGLILGESQNDYQRLEQGD